MTGMIEAGHACADVHEFNALLLRWLGELMEKTIACETGFKKDFITVPIGGGRAQWATSKS